MAKKYLVPIDMTGQEIRNVRAQSLANASLPAASSSTGQFAYDSTNNALVWSDGTSWIQAKPGSVTYATPGSSAVGDAAAQGAATTVSRSDHVHGRESFGAVTAETTFGGSSSNGAATTPARSDHTHGNPASPTASSVGAVANNGGATSLAVGLLSSRPASPAAGTFYFATDNQQLSEYNGSAWLQVSNFGTAQGLNFTGAAADGTATTYARSDHNHGGPGYGSAGSSSPGDSAASGSATTISRSDHVHARADSYGLVGAIAALSITGASAAGVASTIARGDHAHAGPGFGSVTSGTAFGAASANGSAATVARSDHAHGTPAHDAAAHSAIKVSDLASPNATVNFGAQKITNLADPTVGSDAANKNYVDGVASGLDFKASVRASTTANVLLSNPGTAVFDGVTLTTGDRLLVKSQTTTSENGIYVFNTSSTALVRSTDADQTGELTGGALLYVESGTLNGGTQWIISTTGTITIGSTGITWTQFSGANTTTAGGGLLATGNVFSVGAGTGITVNADDVAINTAVVVRKFAQAVGDGTSTSITVTHNLGTQDITVGVYTNSGAFDEVNCDVQHTSTNTATLLFSVAPASNAYRVVIHG